MKNSGKLTIVLMGLFVLVALSSLAIAADEYDWTDYSDVTTGGAFLGLGLVCIILPIIWLVIGILIAIWVYKDAEKRGSSGALWLIIVILTGIIGLIIWLVIRPPIGGAPKSAAASDRKCPSCGRGIPMDAQVCPYCGKKFGE